MPKYRYLALAAAGAMLLSPAGAAYASSAHPAAKKPVLTTSKVGGSAVKKGAKLTASLAKGSDLTVSFGSIGGATCSKSSITSKVTANPNSKGSAALSLTGQTASSCKLTGEAAGLGTLSSVKTVNFPADVTVKPGKGGGSVTITESSKSKPFGLIASVKVTGIGTLACAFTAKSISAKASNKGNTVKVSKAKLSLNASKSNNSDCSDVGTTVSLSVTYGPLKDGSKKVFVS